MKRYGWTTLTVLMTAIGVSSAQGISVRYDSPMEIIEPVVAAGEDSTMTMAAVTDSGQLVVWNVDYQGTLIWAETLSTTMGPIFQPVDIIATGDSGYVVSANIPSVGGVILSRFDRNGNLINALTFQSDSTISVSSIRIINDNLIAAGFYNIYPRKGFSMVVDSLGNVISSMKFVSGVPTAEIEFLDVNVGLQGEIVFTGRHEQKPLFIGTDNSLSSILYDHIYAGYNYISAGRALTPDYYNRHYLIAGSMLIGSNTYGAVFITDSIGNLRSTITYETMEDNEFRDIIKHPNGNFYVITGMAKEADPTGDAISLMIDDAGGVVDAMLLGDSGKYDYGTRLVVGHDYRVWTSGQTIETGVADHKALLSSFFTPSVMQCAFSFNPITGFPNLVDTSYNVSMAPVSITINPLTLSSGGVSLNMSPVCTVGSSEKSERCNPPFIIRNSFVHFDRGVKWEIYDLNGRNLGNGKGGSRELKSGTYLIRTGAGVFKTIVH